MISFSAWRHPLHVLGLGWIVLIAVPTWASDKVGESGWHILPEPKFMAHEITWPIEGSSRAVCLPVREGRHDPVPLSLKDVADPTLTRARILREGHANAAHRLESLEPSYIRDSHGVIRYAVIASEDPLTASVVFAPGFAEHFAETIGPDPLVVIPNRFQVIIFPRSAPPGSDLSERVFSEYHATNYPISREVFEARDGTLKAVGLMR